MPSHSTAGRLLLLILAGLASWPALASAERPILLGRSLLGRPIDAYEVGNRSSPRKVLVVGCIHGNEPAGIAVAHLLEESSPRQSDLWILPVLNPDGFAADRRGNARGVDLNRNFPWRWRPLGGIYDSGPRPLSEPESRIAYRLIERIRPTISIWFHQHLGVVDESGGSLAVERRFASLAALPLARLPRYPGSATGWENHSLPGTTAFVVELPPGPLSPRAATRYAHGVLRLAEAG
jgi:murein peptide amidase A